MKRDTKPTTTILVQEHLQRLDDFAPIPAIAQAIGRTNNQVSAALVWLKRCGQVDCTEYNGALWWCAAYAADPRRVVLSEIKAEKIVKPNRMSGIKADKQQR